MANVSPFELLVDDATALLPDAPVGLHEATAVHGARSDARHGAFLLRDTDLPLVRGFGGRLAVVVTGGAGQVAGPAGLCGRLGLDLARLHVALRDPDDLPGNARRVVAAVDDARAAGSLDEAVHVAVEVPVSGSGVSAGWLAAADELAAAGLGLALRLGAGPGGGPGGDRVPRDTALAMVDAALDRETPFTVLGLARALPTAGAHGALNLLVATQLLFEGGSDPAGALAETDVAALLARTTPDDLGRARRWCTSVASDDVEALLHDLDSLPGDWTEGRSA